MSLDLEHEDGPLQNIVNLSLLYVLILQTMVPHELPLVLHVVLDVGQRLQGQQLGGQSGVGQGLQRVLQVDVLRVYVEDLGK